MFSSRISTLTDAQHYKVEQDGRSFSLLITNADGTQSVVEVLEHDGSDGRRGDTSENGRAWRDWFVRVMAEFYPADTYEFV